MGRQKGVRQRHTWQTQRWRQRQIEADREAEGGIETEKQEEGDGKKAKK